MPHPIQDALTPAQADAWVLLTSHRLPRLQRTIDAILVTPGAILAFARDRATAEAAAIDLADFHEGCRGLPVLPVALLHGERVTLQHPLPFPGAAPVLACTRLLLPLLLAQIARFPPRPGFDPAAWQHAPYRPVPALIEAACALYANHDAAHLLLTTSTRTDLARTRTAIHTAIDTARTTARKHIVFVTGHPGAGKTLCGLDLAFSPNAQAAFLTGNPALLHVLRAALARDALTRGLAPRAARQRIEAVVQPLHAFRDHHIRHPAPPPDRILVIDEAQRCWTEAFARSKTRNRPTKLTHSEPAHILDIMARHEGWSAIVCLLGGGQEIHAGEGGLAAWSEALASRPIWQAHAPPADPATTDPRQSLTTPARTVSALHLGRPVRAWRAPRLVAWVDAMLANDPAAARRLAAPGLPIRLTRSLHAMRATLRTGARARQAAPIHGPALHGPALHGLVATAGARRLRAEGLGGLLWHQDEDAVARWFLDPWPDIRSAEALEVAATEFGVQGLELDRVGLCWDLDLARTPDGKNWDPRAFRATKWTSIRAEDSARNKRNAYRVLLTRARRETIIWIPNGDPNDRTRDPGRYEALAAYLGACGIEPLDAATPYPQDIPMPEAALL